MDEDADMSDCTSTGEPSAAAAGEPLVYVVTACRDAADTIGQTIESVLSQECLAAYFIVDGASTDGTLGIITACAERDSRVRYVSEPDAGIYDAMNKGIGMCLGSARPHDLVATLNADDAYLPGALEAVARAAGCHPDADLLYGNVEQWNAAGAPTGRVFLAPETLSSAGASHGMPIAHPATFVRARAFRAIGVYDTTYRIAADYEFVLRLLDAGLTTHHVARVLAAFRYGGVSTRYETASYKEAIRARVAHGSRPAAEWARFYKRRLFARIFALTRWIPGVTEAQRRFGASARDPDWTDRA